ncbi:uncharacterized protein B0I36DRAFT_339345 [Microdochium trichocladiopsis]|uniref:Uncharacterized protein n=1 Tax=Microdochium trichocladiopsis TaxID=1682393 RepID=A0A9P9BL65_9PEZI|nr:uncharacterized protein B0I36DRAFT_339345 [Microdochium trichocladiopsis]KAH7012474.1 hypothetical protein B0I36DRAFT_339345 [Microdochium trichocladiopsis]
MPLKGRRAGQPSDPDAIGKLFAAYNKGRDAPWLDAKPVAVDWEQEILQLAQRYRVDHDKEQLDRSLGDLKKSLNRELDNCAIGNGWNVWYGWYAVNCIQGTFKQHQIRHGQIEWKHHLYWHYGVELFNMLVDDRLKHHGIGALNILACFANSRYRGAGLGSDRDALDKYAALDLHEPPDSRPLPLIPWWIAELFELELSDVCRCMRMTELRARYGDSVRQCSLPISTYQDIKAACALKQPGPHTSPRAAGQTCFDTEPSEQSWPVAQFVKSLPQVAGSPEFNGPVLPCPPTPAAASAGQRSFSGVSRRWAVDVLHPKPVQDTGSSLQALSDRTVTRHAGSPLDDRVASLSIPEASSLPAALAFDTPRTIPSESTAPPVVALHTISAQAHSPAELQGPNNPTSGSAPTKGQDTPIPLPPRADIALSDQTRSSVHGQDTGEPQGLTGLPASATGPGPVHKLDDFPHHIFDSYRDYFTDVVDFSAPLMKLVHSLASFDLSTAKAEVVPPTQRYVEGEKDDSRSLWSLVETFDKLEAYRYSIPHDRLGILREAIDSLDVKSLFGRGKREWTAEIIRLVRGSATLDMDVRVEFVVVIPLPRLAVHAPRVIFNQGRTTSEYASHHQWPVLVFLERGHSIKTYDEIQFIWVSFQKID